MKLKKIYLINLIFFIIIPLNLRAYYWGTTGFSAQAINSSLSNLPGTTNIMIHKIRVRNTGDSTNDFTYPTNKAYPHLYEIEFENIGTLPSSNILRARLWYDEDGIWNNGDEKECNTAYECQSNVLFDADYSPIVFGHSSDIAYFGPNLNIFIASNKTYYLYLTVDLSTNIIDNASLDTKTVNNETLIHAGGDWYFYRTITNIINSPGQITTAVHATNLKIENEPTLVNINKGFSLTVSARDKYGNIDKDYTNSVYFMATNIPPTPYEPPFAFISNTHLNPYKFTAGDNGYHIFTTNAFKFLKTGVYKIQVSDGTLNDDWSSEISASPEVHHFNISDHDDNNLSSFLITAGLSFKESGITNIKVSARNYVDAIVDNYQGDLYFILETPSSLYQNKIPYDNDSSTLPTTSSTDRFAITNNGYQLIDADYFCIYNAGNNKLRVIDEFGFKGEVNLSIVPDVAYQFNIQSDTPLLSGEPFRFYIELTDKWSNVVDASDEIEITIFKNKSPFNDHTIPESAVLEHGKKYFEKEDNIKVIEPGTYTIKVKDKDKTNITYEGTITVEMGAKNYLNIINNYVKPGEIKEVPIYYNNPYNEIVTVNIKIFDIRGNLIKKFNPIEIPSGPSKADIWDLKNDSSNEVSPGIYIVQTKDSKGNKSRQMVVFVK